jgi:hypothetical protein
MMTHHNASEDRRTIPGLDGRWTIDRAGQVYGPNGVIPGIDFDEARRRAFRRVGGDLAAPGSMPDLVLTLTPEGEEWHASPPTVEWLWWSPKRPAGTAQSTGTTMPADGDTARMWFSLTVANGEPEQTIHLFHGPSVARMTFAQG